MHLLAGHALDRIGPQIEIGLAQARLQFERALRIAQPIIRDLADGFHYVDDLGVLVVAAAFFARLEIGGQGLAALLHHAGDVAGELLHVGGAAFDRFGRGSHGNRLNARLGAGQMPPFRGSDGVYPITAARRSRLAARPARQRPEARKRVR